MDDPDLQNLSEAWHSRARECRTAAERFRSSDARQRMLTAARDFDEQCNGQGVSSPTLKKRIVITCEPSEPNSRLSWSVFVFASAQPRLLAGNQ